MQTNNKTPHLGLHQWEPGDNFQRTDFNTDFATIDDALAQTAATAQRALDGLVPVNYNLYSLLLREYYGGKYTGYKRALVFDGFLDGERVASCTGAAGLAAGGGILLETVGLKNFSVNYGTQMALTNQFVGNGAEHSTYFTPDGRGRLNTVSFTCQTGVSSALKVTLSQGGKLLFSGRISLSGGFREYGIYMGVNLEPGISYQLRLQRDGQDGIDIRRQNTSTAFGFTATATPAAGQSGSVTATPVDVGAFLGGRAWVRHSGGTVGMSLNGTAMEVVEERDTQNNKGNPCKETAFSLERPGDGALTVALSLSGTRNFTVHDYGLILL